MTWEINANGQNENEYNNYQKRECILYKEDGKSCTDREDNDKLPKWNEANRVFPLGSLLKQHYFKHH